ncbi:MULTISPECIES: hypothetical protein [Dolichospermum]|jgi:hypothetical protein|uniref:hypothetical protein n=1 Tax=Dolichospermum TaxID=748770 RepID=UPI0016803F43|nr:MULTISPECIES: hypothetical protein [Dolichospermum]MBD2442396.1 hypothetical protein [Dolichospermum sp. FACHB-1091]MDB9465267.1 hypothetical protein [Dolichospermum circinale CS-539/09]MDB9472731.1 hypothetical protein [Dolichospermum circinale CS-539]
MNELKLTDITQNFTEEDACKQIVSWVTRNSTNHQVINIDKVIEDYLEKHKPNGWDTKSGVYCPTYYDTETGVEAFYDAAWYFCSRGILRPAPLTNQEELRYPKNFCAKFLLTSFGKKWISKCELNECMPSEHGRFSKLLSDRDNLFGQGYQSRSQEALSCYRSQNYFACCVMCGATYESVLLALAIEKSGNEQDILKKYNSNRGRTTIENILIGQVNDYIKADFRKYSELLKYWRDDAAHGASLNIGEEEAFTSLILLLRFIQYAEKHFSVLTSSQTI